MAVPSYLTESKTMLVTRRRHAKAPSRSVVKGGGGAFPHHLMHLCSLRAQSSGTSVSQYKDGSMNSTLAHN
ncbi:hypothetical protein E2C01_026694 [Portunus trituberculatus]|uniref:Uncharacterized protein n=1 Tax=Portunus trituberculatus TaxID=210409 RepID=A0A5B7EJB5_PORTR|nr:hypothetical protein [Portunus trituberculatus]